MPRSHLRVKPSHILNIRLCSPVSYVGTRTRVHFLWNLTRTQKSWLRQESAQVQHSGRAVLHCLTDHVDTVALWHVLEDKQMLNCNRFVTWRIFFRTLGLWGDDSDSDFWWPDSDSEVMTSDSEVKTRIGLGLNISTDIHKWEIMGSMNFDFVNNVAVT